MVKLLLTGFLAASLTSLQAAALPEGHEPDEIEVHGHGGLLERLQTATETDDAKLTIHFDLLHKLSQIGDNKNLGSSSESAALETKVPCESGGAVAYKAGTEVEVKEIAKAICKSYELLKTSTNLDAEAQKWKLAVQKSNEIYATGLLLVVSKVDDSTTPKAQAIVRLLSLGQLNASGMTTIEQVDNSSKLMESLTNALRKNHDKLGTAETLLHSSIIEAWPALNPDVRKKLVWDLIGYSPVKH